VPAPIAALLEPVLATLSGLLVATPLGRLAIGVLAAILLVAVLAVGAYQQLSDRASEQIATGSVDSIAPRNLETRLAEPGSPAPSGSPAIAIAPASSPPGSAIPPVPVSAASMTATAPMPPVQSFETQPERDGADSKSDTAPALLPADPAVPRANSPDQIRKAQIELKRLGCFGGPENGALGKMTQEAVRTYWRRTGQRAGTIDITDAFVADLAQHDTGLCKPTTVAMPRPRPDQAPREPTANAGQPPRPPKPIAATPPAARANAGGGL
jgi:hypothetical protein